MICTFIYFIESYLIPKPDPAIIEKYTRDNPLAVELDVLIQ
ncbi:MAG: hypothetical protein NTV01_13940 [Bacteroidia bacterium]|nr:hypothetical protein [Bacteroidia bacterium]